MSPYPFVVSLSIHERLFGKHVMNVSEGLRVNGKELGNWEELPPSAKSRGVPLNYISGLVGRPKYQANEGGKTCHQL